MDSAKAFALPTTRGNRSEPQGDRTFLTFLTMRYARFVLVVIAANIAMIPPYSRTSLGISLPPVGPPRGISGVVVDDAGACDGARVRFAGGVGGDHTDLLGRFFLPRTASTRSDAVITAWKRGYFIASTPASSDPCTLRIRPLPREDFSDYRWVDSAPGVEAFSCGSCHPGIHGEWSETAHGPRRTAFEQSFKELERSNSDRSAVCLSCHDPAPLKARIDPLDGFSNSGIHCDFCHKVADVTVEHIGLTHGRYGFDLLRPRQGQLIFGPWIDSPRPENTYAPIQRSSRMCAPCHEGVVFGIRVYETWSEWLASPAHSQAVQCQDCHMKPTGTMANVAPQHGGVDRDPRRIANHRFFDGSHFDMLRRSLHLDVKLDGMTAVVTVEARDVGHRIPTGSPDRNLNLSVTWYDLKNRVVSAEHRIIAKRLRDANGRSPVPFWLAADIESDTRLEPHRPRRWEFEMPQEGAATLRVELVYRRSWPGPSQEQGNRDDGWLIQRVILPIKSSGR